MLPTFCVYIHTSLSRCMLPTLPIYIHPGDIQKKQREALYVTHIPDVHTPCRSNIPVYHGLYVTHISDVHTPNTLSHWLVVGCMLPTFPMYIHHFLCNYHIFNTVGNLPSGRKALRLRLNSQPEYHFCDSIFLLQP